MGYSTLDSSVPSSADRNLKAELQAEHVKVLWLILASVIGILSLFNWTDRLLKYSFTIEDRDAFSMSKSELEKGTTDSEISSHPGHTSCVRRISAALLMAFKIAAFRLTVPVGSSAVASFTEFFFIFGYTLTMFTLLWIQSRRNIT